MLRDSDSRLSARSRFKFITLASLLFNCLFTALFFRSLQKPCLQHPSTHNQQRLTVQTPTLGKLYTAPEPSAELHIPNELSLNSSFTLSSHLTHWSAACPLIVNDSTTHQQRHIPFCPQTATTEQGYQMQWFGSHVVAGKRPSFPSYLNCIHLPPLNYEWPVKQPQLPAQQGESYVHWSNLRVNNMNDLIEFNRATPKNLYHFDAPRYDLDALDELKFAAQHIPFKEKVRLVLDLGAGGGSLGLLLKRKYDIQTLSTVFPDWPYCEYISERGGLCMLVDVMESLPFAKFSFDVVHMSWVYHGQQVHELLPMFTEINRVIRPGGYLWMRGGWSGRQVDTLKWLMEVKLGYVSLVGEINEKPMEVTKKVFFGEGLPYEVDWNVIWVKPIRAEPKADCSNEPQLDFAKPTSSS